MSDLNELKQSILDVLKTDDSGAMSATAVSKAVGFAKSNKRVQAALAEMATEETVITAEHDRGYTIYYKDADAALTETESSSDTAEFTKGDVPENDVKGAPRTIGSFKIPTATYNYNVEEDITITVEGEEGEDVEVQGIRISPPEGDKVFELAPWQRLLVINQNEDYRFIVEKPEDIFEAINIYTDEKGIGNFLVTDMESNAAVTEESLEDMDVALLFLSISRHNKAGASFVS